MLVYLLIYYPRKCTFCLFVCSFSFSLCVLYMTLECAVYCPIRAIHQLCVHCIYLSLSLSLSLSVSLSLCVCLSLSVCLSVSLCLSQSLSRSLSLSLSVSLSLSLCTVLSECFMTAGPFPAIHPPWRHWYNDLIPPYTKPQDRRRAREERDAERER